MAMFLVVCKNAKMHAQMHQNTFLSTPDAKKHFFKAMFLVVLKHAKMHQNTFLTTPDVEKYLFYGHVSGGLEACANASKHIFNHSRRKNIKFFLVVWKHAQCIKTRF